MKPLCYVAGPYASDPVANTRRAIETGMELWATGQVVPLIPHLSLLSNFVHPMPETDWYAFDLDLLEHCDAVLRIPGESKGADREVERARELGLPVFETVDAVVEWVGEWIADHEDPPLTFVPMKRSVAEMFDPITKETK